MIRIGICTSSTHYSEAAEAGFDFVELPGTELALMSAGDFTALCDRVHRTGVPVSSLNAIFTPEQKFVGGHTTAMEELRSFFGTMIRRAGLLGVDQFGVGGGYARTVPEGFDRMRAAQQYIGFLRMLSDMAGSAGVKVSIEYLHPGETNMINDIESALAMREAVSRENVGILVDSFHADFSLAPENVSRAGGLLWHCHVACPKGRFWPQPDDGTDYAPFLTAIAANGQPDRVSIEGNQPGKAFLMAAREALAVLREAAGC